MLAVLGTRGTGRQCRVRSASGAALTQWPSSAPSPSRRWLGAGSGGAIRSVPVRPVTPLALADGEIRPRCNTVLDAAILIEKLFYKIVDFHYIGTIDSECFYILVHPYLVLFEVTSGSDDLPHCFSTIHLQGRPD